MPQDPDTALNPVFTIGDQIVETMLAHKVARRRDVHERMLDLLMARDDTIFVTGSQMADWFRDQDPDGKRMVE